MKSEVEIGKLRKPVRAKCMKI